MIQEIFIKFKDVLHETIKHLTGSDKRIALAKTAEAIFIREVSLNCLK